MLPASIQLPHDSWSFSTGAAGHAMSQAMPHHFAFLFPLQWCQAQAVEYLCVHKSLLEPLQQGLVTVNCNLNSYAESVLMEIIGSACFPGHAFFISVCRPLSCSVNSLLIIFIALTIYYY